MKLHHDDLMQALTVWVLGKCLEATMGPLAPYHSTFTHNNGMLDYARFHAWAMRCAHKVSAHVTRNATLDASYSDFESTMSQEATRVFGMHLPVSVYDVRTASTALGWPLRKTQNLLRANDTTKSESQSTGQDLGQFIWANLPDRNNHQY